MQDKYYIYKITRSEDEFVYGYSEFICSAKSEYDAIRIFPHRFDKVLWSDIHNEWFYEFSLKYKEEKDLEDMDFYFCSDWEKDIKNLKIEKWGESYIKEKKILFLGDYIEC